METLLPQCENPYCKKVDEELRANLIRRGAVNLGAQPDLHAPLLCGDCRAAVFSLIESVKDNAKAEEELATQPN